MARYRPFLRYLFGSVLLLFSCMGWADDLNVSDMPRVDANAAVRYLEDPQGRLTIEQLRPNESGWRQNGRSAFNQGYSNSVWWLHLTVRNTGDQESKRYLE